MHTRILTYTHTRWLVRLLLLAGFLFASTLAALDNTLVSHAASIPGGNVADPFVRAIDIAKPAVVRILTTQNSTLTVNFSSTNSVKFPQKDGASYPLTLSGSGAFVSSRGDILTADHVVNPPHDTSLKQYLDSLAAQDVADYMNKNGTSQVSMNQVQQQLDNDTLQSSAAYGTVTSEVYLSTDYTGPQTAADINSVPADLHATVDKIEQQSSFDQKDVAIIHAPFSDTPSVQIGDSSTVQQQDELRIIGFPGNGDVSGNNVPNDFFALSVNPIFVSSTTKHTDSGAPVIQVSGNVEHGDSGGPAFNSDGKVVGIVSFGLISNGEPGSTSFLQASNSARELLQSLNLDTTPGTFQTLWSKAFTEYSLNTPQHWHQANSDFQQLSTSYPLFKGITPFLNYASSQAASEATPTPTSQKPTAGTGTTSQPVQQGSTFNSILLTIGVLLVMVFLVIVLFTVALRRRSKKPDPQRQAALPQQRPQSAPAPQSRPNAVPTTPAPQPRPPVAQSTPAPTIKPIAPVQPVSHADGMSAFGAPPPTNTTISTPLRAWPCGHMNRTSARFCTICGEPAP